MIAVRFGIDYLRNSWHLAGSAGSKKTLCGRVVPHAFDVRTETPGNLKTCERCLVVAEKRREALLTDVPGMTDLFKPAGWGEWLDLGPDVAITRPVEITSDGQPIKRSWLAHKRPDGRNDALARVEFSPGHHELVSEDPLTISPSLLCPDATCGFHGFIQGGKWVPA